MTQDERSAARIAAAIGETLDRFDVPPVPHARIAAGVARVQPPRPHRRTALAFTFGIVAVALLFGFGLGAAGAARAFLDRVSVLWLPSGQAIHAKPHAITLEQAQTSRNVAFVEPKGLPPGTVLASVGVTPQMHDELTLVYRIPDDRVFEVRELRDERPPGKRSDQCLSLSGPALLSAVQSGRLRRYLDTNDPRELPHGVRIVPCRGHSSFSVRNTLVFIRNVDGRLTPSELSSIVRATAR